VQSAFGRDSVPICRLHLTLLLIVLTMGASGLLAGLRVENRIYIPQVAFGSCFECRAPGHEEGVMFTTTISITDMNASEDTLGPNTTSVSVRVVSFDSMGNPGAPLFPASERLLHGKSTSRLPQNLNEAEFANEVTVGDDAEGIEFIDQISERFSCSLSQ